MSSNRYYSKSAQEVIDSYEWLYRERLEALDALARSMYTDLTLAYVRKEHIPGIMNQFFAEMWEQVAATEEQKARKGAPRWIGKRPRSSNSQT